MFLALVGQQKLNLVPAMWCWEFQTLAKPGNPNAGFQMRRAFRTELTASQIIPTDCFLFLIFVGRSPRYWISGLYRVGIFLDCCREGESGQVITQCSKCTQAIANSVVLATFCCLSNSLLGDGRSPGNDLRTAFQFLRVATSPFPFQRKRQRSGTNTFTNLSSLTSGALQEGLYFFDIMS